ncbi:DinB family protein [Spirosoma fluminis]
MENRPPEAVTDAERTYAIDALRTTQAHLHQSLENLSPAQLAHKPSADRWSITECVEHIALVEKGIANALLASMNLPEDPDRRATIRVSDVDVIKAVRSRKVTLSAPTPFVPTGRFATTDAALQAFDEQRNTIITYVQHVQDNLRLRYFEHPALGTLDAYQAVLVMASHAERHRKQVEELKAGADFPQ